MSLYYPSLILPDYKETKMPDASNSHPENNLGAGASGSTGSEKPSGIGVATHKPTVGAGISESDDTNKKTTSGNSSVFTDMDAAEERAEKQRLANLSSRTHRGEAITEDHPLAKKIQKEANVPNANDMRNQSNDSMTRTLQTR
jgi:hypothetical protein